MSEHLRPSGREIRTDQAVAHDLIGVKSDTSYSILMRARLLSTRGLGDDLGELDVSKLVDELEGCRRWVNELCLEAEAHG